MTITARRIMTIGFIGVALAILAVLALCIAQINEGTTTLGPLW